MRLKLLFLSSVFLVVAGTCFCEGKDVYTITKHGWSYIDVFKVPASKCTVNATNCTSYNNANADQQEPCTCLCPYHASTFGFFSGSWTCLRNAEIRRQAGCQFMFYTDSFDGRKLEIDNDALMIVEQDTSYQAVFPSGTCSVNYTSSLYFDCDGTWKALRSKERSNLVDINDKQRFSWDSDLRNSWRYTFTMSTTKTSLSGRIISLYFNCTSPSKSSCLLFKIAGEITCPVDFRPSSTPNPISATLTTTLESNFTKSPSPGNQTRDGHRGGSASSPLPWTIVAAVLIVIFVIILIGAIFGFMCWKKRRGENVLLMDMMLAMVKKKRTSSTTPAVGDAAEEEEEVYAEIPEHLVQRQPTRTEILVGSDGINNYAFEPGHQPVPSLPEPRYASLLRGSIIQEEPSTDEEGYLEPRQMPVYVEFESIKEVPGSTENSKTTKNDEGQDHNEQQDASRRMGKGDGAPANVYACVNKEKKLPNVPPNDKVKDKH